jgi:hypothetical protein
VEHYGIGPQRVGGRYFCGYWQEEYDVLAVTTGRAWSITVRTVGATETRTHCTPWDARRDRIISQPA